MEGKTIDYESINRAIYEASEPNGGGPIPEYQNDLQSTVKAVAVLSEDYVYRVTDNRGYCSVLSLCGRTDCYNGPDRLHKALYGFLALYVGDLNLCHRVLISYKIL